MASLEQYYGDHLIIIGAVGLGLCCLEVNLFVCNIPYSVFVSK